MKSLAMFLAVAIGAVAGVAATQDASAGRMAVTQIATAAPQSATPVAETKSEMTTISGTVSSFEAGRSITILRPNATTVTYRVDARSVLPSDLARGRKVVVRTVTRPGAAQPLVRKVTYTKTTKRAKTAG